MLSVKRTSILACGLLGLALLAGCGGGSGSGTPVFPNGGGGGGGGATGTYLSILLTDKPIEGLESVVVTIESVEVHQTGGPFYEVLEGPITVDLVELKDALIPLGEIELEAGKYTQVRLIVSEGEVTVDGKTHPLKIPSGEVKIQGPWTIPEGVLAVLVLDFDAEESLHVVQAGNKDKYILRPVIKPIDFEIKTIDDCIEQESTSPADGDTDVSVDTTVSVTFPEGTEMPEDPSGLITVTDPDGEEVPGEVTVAGTTATFTPDDPLAYETTYTVTAHRSALPDFIYCPDQDSFSFTTEAEEEPEP